MTAKSTYSIGEVVKRLKPEFGDLTISKLRFLEDKGLIKPSRTKSGYRKFSEKEVKKLSVILKLQKERFLPLSVIKSKISTLSDKAMEDISGVKIERTQGLLASKSKKDNFELQIKDINKSMAKFGIEQRHLKMYETFADREAMLFYQAVAPMIKNNSKKAEGKLSDLLRSSQHLKNILLEKALSELLKKSMP
ncbi:MAG: MerR family transcriptional regulator [Actinobacteria bacterium]|nr:MAG: MerR family transcriptional regulator [Actinomycetota bacterium]